MEIDDPPVRGAADAMNAQQSRVQGLNELLRQRTRDLRQLNRTAVFDISARAIASTDTNQSFVPPTTIEPIPALYREYPPTGPIVSRPFLGTDGKWNTLLARPLLAQDGTLTGVVAGSINLSYFEELYRAVELSKNGALSLSLPDGTVLARFPHVNEVIGTNFGVLPPFDRMSAQFEAATLPMQNPVDGITLVTAIRALQVLPLAVTVSVQDSRVLADWRRQAVTLVCFAVALSGVVVVVLLSRRLRQLERLLEQSRDARVAAEQTTNRLLQQVSERERSEGALRQAQRIEAIGELTGGLAHDFNNLLMVVLGNVDILQRRAVPDPNGLLAPRLAAIRTAAERGATLTGHLLAFARRQPLMPKAVDLNATILGMRHLLDNAVGKRARMRFQLAEQLWPAMVDQSRTELVILNLVINARDAMPHGGVITIETANRHRTETNAVDGPPPGDYISITVRDTGTGIAPEILTRVFEPFFSTKALGAGSGLGLSQVFGTAKQSGGEVHIATEVGVGTAVTVDFPRAAAVVSKLADAKTKGSDTNILLVDDDGLVRASAAAMLRDLGYRVRDVGSGECALKALDQDTDIDILLTDLVMPGMNGSQLATVARSRHAGLSVAFISGYADQIGDTLRRQDRLIAKPFSADDLHRTIEAVVAERQGALAGA